MRDDVVPEDRGVVVSDLDGVESIRCVSMQGKWTYAVVQAFLQVCYDHHLQTCELAPRVDRTDCRGHTESFLLRRMNSGPGVKAAFAMGTTARAAQRGVLENFMVLFCFESC